MYNFRRANLEDEDLLVNLRLEFMRYIKTIDSSEVFRSNTKEYFVNHLNTDDLIAYLAFENECAVSVCIMCIYNRIPLRSNLSGKHGLLLNVYTVESHRRKGLSYELISRIINDAKNIGVDKIFLEYSDKGYPLYKKLGFKELEKQMVLSL